MRRQKSKFLQILLVFVSMAVVLAVFTSLEYTRKLPDTGRMPAAFHLTADELVNDFVAEEFGATEKYSGKVLSVYGMIGKVETNEAGSAILLKSFSSEIYVLCQFTQENTKNIKPLKPGMLITVKGVCSGFLLDIILDRCVIQD